MREIKFRAVISPKTTIYFTLEELITSDPIFHIRELLIPWLRQGNKPDEYTGLKDKNGNPIYEGDIVKIDISAFGERIGVVELFEGEFCVKVNNEYYSGGINYDFPEVIGNIYENPELVK